MSNELRKILGLSLWWTKGTKAYKDKRWKNSWIYNIEITNTNPKIIKVFLDFLRMDMGVDENRLKLQLQIHENDNIKELETYWSSITNIPKSRFNKIFIRPVGNKIGKSLGTCKIRYTDKRLYNQLSGMLKNLLDGYDFEQKS